MAKAVAPPAAPREWVAKDVDELRSVWNALRPESDDAETERRFFGRLLTPEEAGAAFERWVPEAFRLSGAAGHHAFPVSMSEIGTTREQLDGLLRDGQSAYLLESKFWPGKVDFSPIAYLHTLIGFRPEGTMGLFFSPFGFTEPAMESVKMLRPIKILLFRKQDLDWALPPAGLTKRKATEQFRGRMLEMVRRKRFLAIRNASPLLFVGDVGELFNPEET